jgi:hypothetical protein
MRENKENSACLLSFLCREVFTKPTAYSTSQDQSLNQYNAQDDGNGDDSVSSEKFDPFENPAHYTPFWWIEKSIFA